MGYTKRKDGRFQTKIYLGTDSNGKPQYKYIYADSLKELKKLDTDLRSRLCKGIDILALEDSFETWARRLYTVKEIEMSEREYNLFKFRCGYFSEKIGKFALKDISQAELQPIVNELYRANPATKKPSGKRTIERYLTAASSVFDYAIENRATDFNPCKYVKIPKQSTTTQRRALRQEERKWIEETPHRAQTAAMLMMYSGLRRGEATALLWSDVDLINKTISVTKSYDFKECRLKQPKTASGNRVVSIPQKLVDYLANVNKSSIYVISRPDGRIMATDSAWRRMWDNYILTLDKKYGKRFDSKEFENTITIEPFTPHCLRHTFCTMMYEAGIDVLTAKEQMGHTDVKTTMSIYTHLDQTYKKKSILKLDEYLSKTAEF